MRGEERNPANPAQEEEPTKAAEPGGEPASDTEGHSLSMNPTLAGELARARAADVEREARGRIFRREARDTKRQGR
ncbi:MAG TPA: hypothetical protein VHK06_03465 [Candidatus Limnocylindria bacterium]|jgi:hypothetical protein|nr:hypothetical protein [Candidatus Limnocylindria bacterium]